MKIGFLFNHDQVHQVAHSLPIALALAAADLDAEIVLAVTNERLRAEVVRLAGAAISRGALQLVRLSLATRRSRALARLTDGLVPAAKLLIYADNLDFFRSLDVLVVAEKTSLVLKTRYGLDRLRIVHTRHGAGDRAIGFDRASAAFDHVLVSGPKIRDRLMADAGVDARRISVVGYPKFDLVARSGLHPLIDDGRPVVLYNPHVSPHLSSWFKLGRQVLDWFVEHDDHHLIFAPHVMLFERKVVLTVDRMRIHRPGRIDERYLRAPNIHIDLGSRLCTTMAYTERADIYLGDVSSQVYEFMRRPRPCIFLDAHRAAWRHNPDYLHWRAGRVITHVAALGPALAQAHGDHARHYCTEQERLFGQSFDVAATPSAQRAARVLAQIAELPWPFAQAADAVPATEPLVACG